MQNVFSPEGLAAVREFARAAVVAAFDYDGTLAPIVAEPSQAGMRKETKDLLADVARLYPVTVISGRARADVMRFLEGVDVRKVVGNHGIEGDALPADASRILNEVQRWRTSLEEQLAPIGGIRIEPKGYSLSVHYRRAADQDAALVAILRAVETLGPLRTVGGKQVVNVVPLGAPHKGTALDRVRAELGCARAIFLGDDVTDEDVFASTDEAVTLGVSIEARAESLARFFLEDQLAVDAFLRVLIEARS